MAKKKKSGKGRGAWVFGILLFFFTVGGRKSWGGKQRRTTKKTYRRSDQKTGSTQWVAKGDCLNKDDSGERNFLRRRSSRGEKSTKEGGNLGS